MKITTKYDIGDRVTIKDRKNDCDGVISSVTVTIDREIRYGVCCEGVLGTVDVPEHKLTKGDTNDN
jgi:hypothetical protein